MSILIDQDELKKVFASLVPYIIDDSNEEYFYGLNAAYSALTNAPTVDAVPVVRCGECKYKGMDNCPMEFYWDNHPMDEKAFCSYGKRNE